MLQSFIALLIGMGLVGLTMYLKLYWVAAPLGMAVLYFCTFTMIIWLASENGSDHGYYAKLVICRMTDKTGECP